MRPKPAKWWFAWRPVRTRDTDRIVWLKWVYREWWYSKSYFENPVQGKRKHPNSGEEQ